MSPVTTSERRLVSFVRRKTLMIGVHICAPAKEQRVPAETFVGKVFAAVVVLDIVGTVLASGNFLLDPDLRTICASYLSTLLSLL